MGLRRGEYGVMWERGSDDSDGDDAAGFWEARALEWEDDEGDGASVGVEEEEKEEEEEEEAGEEKGD